MKHLEDIYIKHDDSLQKEITKGKQQNLRGVRLSAEGFIIDFVSRITCEVTRVIVREVFSFIAKAHDIDKISHGVQPLLGFTFEKQDDIYTYCLFTNVHEMIFKSKHFAEIKDLTWDTMVHDELQSTERERQFFSKI